MTKYIFISAALILSSFNTYSSAASGDLEILGDACNALGVAEKRKQCLSALERFRGETKPLQKTTKSTRPQTTRESITFKDIPLGKAGVKPALSEICRQVSSNKPSSYNKDDPCDFPKERNLVWLSYGNLVHTLAWIELGEGGALESVDITESKGAMLELVNILQEKYGKPIKTTNSVENKMGTKFDKELFVWVDIQGNRITVESIYDKIDQGRVVIESSARVAARDAAEKQLKEAGKSNL